MDLQRKAEQKPQNSSLLRHREQPHYLSIPLVSGLSALLFLLCLFLAGSVNAKQCELTMGYRTSERMPFIHASPDNQGFYLDLYERAAKRIGCKLNILRAPKKRILRELAFGRVDFYPGFGYSEKRNESVFFIPNGLMTRFIGVSRPDLEDITDIEQIAEKGLIMLIAPGSYTMGGLPKFLNIRQPPELDVKGAIKLIEEKKGDFYAYEESSLRYYLKSRPSKQFKLHINCCEKTQLMQLGFSRKSPHLQLEPNPHFSPEIPESLTNKRQQLVSHTRAAQFAKALNQMNQTGITKRLHQLYFGFSNEEVTQSRLASH